MQNEYIAQVKTNLAGVLDPNAQKIDDYMEDLS